MSQGLPQFGPAPIIGQRQQQVQAQLQAAISQLSMQIYTQLAVSHITMRDTHQSIDQDTLKQLAKDANHAGVCYFEGLGVIQQHKPTHGEQEPQT